MISSAQIIVGIPKYSGNINLKNKKIGTDENSHR